MKYINTLTIVLLTLYACTAYSGDDSQDTDQLKSDLAKKVKVYEQSLDNEYPEFDQAEAMKLAGDKYAPFKVGDSIAFMLPNQRGKTIKIAGEYRGMDILNLHYFIGSEKVRIASPDIPEHIRLRFNPMKAAEAQAKHIEDSKVKYLRERLVEIEKRVVAHKAELYKRHGFVKCANGVWMTPEECERIKKISRLAKVRVARREKIARQQAEQQRLKSRKLLRTQAFPISVFVDQLKNLSTVEVLDLLGEPNTTYADDTQWVYWKKTIKQHSGKLGKLIVNFENETVSSLQLEFTGQVFHP